MPGWPAVTHDSVQSPDLANRSTIGQILSCIVGRPPGHLIIGHYVDATPVGQVANGNRVLERGGQRLLEQDMDFTSRAILCNLQVAIILDEGPNHLRFLLVEHFLPIGKNQIVGHAALFRLGYKLRLSLRDAHEFGWLAGHEFVEMAPNMGMDQAHNGDGMLSAKGGDGE